MGKLSSKKLRSNIERNIANADRCWHEDHGTEPPKRVKEYHDKMFRKAEYERERRENIKRGVK